MSAQKVELLSPRLVLLYRVLLALLLCVTAVAAAGTCVLADHERKWAISHTRFADWYYSLLAFNQVGAAERYWPQCCLVYAFNDRPSSILLLPSAQAIPGFLFNGSLIGMPNSTLRRCLHTMLQAASSSSKES